jgi:glycosyltransferase involved in cell wall biosynthesis
MRLLAKRNRVLWVNSIGYRAPKASRADMSRIVRKLAAATRPLEEVEPNIFVLNPLAIPAYGSATVQQLNRTLLGQQVRSAMQRLGFDRPINWVFNPAAALLAGDLGEEAIVYYCVDEYSALRGVAAGAIESLERRVLSLADLVVVSSQRLFEAKARFNPSTLLVRHGVDYDHFRSALASTTQTPDDIKGLKGPVLGYFGLISEDWVDRELLAHVARTMPHASLVLIGRSTMDLARLKQCPNVTILGHRPYSSLPAYCKAFDVALIPFPISPVTLHSNPLKAREYLAAGLPVVSTNIPEVRVLGSCRTAIDHDDFVTQIHAALESPGPERWRSASMQTESWAARLAEVEAVLLARMRMRTHSRRLAA